jgi:hypothetical protein
MKKLTFSFLIAGIGFFGACEEKSTRENVFEEIEEDNTSVIFESISPNNPFPEAILEMYSPLYNQKLQPGRVAFEFNIVNYPLGTAQPNHHLVLILNGGNPRYFETPNFYLELNPGAYRAVTYLVDETGIALKDFGNFVERDFRVGETEAFPNSAEPYLAINLPISGAVYDSDEDLIIDFLVLAGDLENDGLKVKISIGDQFYETEKMVPVTIKDLPKGEHQIVISLLKKDGSELEGPFSKLIKTVILK